MGRFEDKTGQRFGRLLALRFLHSSRAVRGKWECLCDCGSLVYAESSCLNNGDTISCGCRKIDHISENFTSHGKSKTVEYRIWTSMIQRCINPKSTSYPNYGGRGILVCDRWLNSFENFLEDMGVRPEERTLDRIDPSGNYSPSNCRWAEVSEQKFNTRRRGDNTSGKTGVSYDKDLCKWKATISYKKQNFNLGYYKNLEEAIAVRESAEMKYYGFTKE